MMQAEPPVAAAEGAAEPDAVAAHVSGEEIEEREEADRIDEAAERGEQQDPERGAAHAARRRRAHRALNNHSPTAATTPQAKTSP